MAREASINRLLAPKGEQTPPSIPQPPAAGSSNSTVQSAHKIDGDIFGEDDVVAAVGEEDESAVCNINSNVYRGMPSTTTTTTTTASSTLPIPPPLLAPSASTVVPPLPPAAWEKELAEEQLREAMYTVQVEENEGDEGASSIKGLLAEYQKLDGLVEKERADLAGAREEAVKRTTREVKCDLRKTIKVCMSASYLFLFHGCRWKRTRPA